MHWPDALGSFEDDDDNGKRQSNTESQSPYSPGPLDVHVRTIQVFEAWKKAPALPKSLANILTRENKGSSYTSLY